MIPDLDIITTTIEETKFGSKTYKITTPNGVGIADCGGHDISMEFSTDVLRINGYIDGIESVCQAVFLILATERYQYLIYSWDYGIELVDLYGKPFPYVTSELSRRIPEALMQDDRVTGVDTFDFQRNGNKLEVSFIVNTVLGDVKSRLEVAI